MLIKLANETRSSVWDLIPSFGIVKSVDVVTGASVLPPSYLSSQSGSFNAELSEDLDVEIKDVKTIALQPYHVNNNLHIIPLQFCYLTDCNFPLSLFEDPIWKA